MAAAQAGKKTTLANLLGGLTGAALPDVSVTDLSQSSQEVLPGALFLAGAGASRHGLEFADEALARGASAIAWEPVDGVRAPALPDGVVGVPVPGLRQATGEIADRFFAAPSASLKVAGITGTNGKTSTTFFLAQALEALGPGCGIMGTLGIGRPAELRASKLTTPDAVGVHRQLAEFRDGGVRHVAMEVSSHAIVQGRVNAVRFDCAGFTNLSRDHLDFHGDMESYASAKEALFTGFRPRHAVINCSDEAGKRIASAMPAGSARILVMAGDAGQPGDHWLSHGDIDAHESGITFQVQGSYGAARLHSCLVGEFNASNLLIALGVLLSWGFSFRQSVRALENLNAPAGRMETFRRERGPLVIVDYAHTPDALEKVLRAARSHARSRLLLVFGCGGERDAGKRPEMGAIAVRLADEVIVTDDNPRNEDPDSIVAAILAGTGPSVSVERDRAAAIESAISAAGDGDVVVIAGKGHEIYQTTMEGRQPFSDRAVVADLLGMGKESVELSP